MKAIRIALGTCLCALFLWGCVTSGREEVTYRALPQAKWHRDTTLSYPLFVPYGGSSYSARVFLRFDNRYDFNHITLKYRLMHADSLLMADTLRIQMLANNGKEPKGGATFRQTEAELFPLFSFPHSGIYTLHLSLCTERPLLRGIDQVGVGYTRRSVLSVPVP